MSLPLWVDTESMCVNPNVILCLVSISCVCMVVIVRGDVYVALCISYSMSDVTRRPRSDETLCQPSGDQRGRFPESAETPQKTSRGQSGMYWIRRFYSFRLFDIFLYTPTDNLSYQNSPTCEEWSSTQNYIKWLKLGTAVVDITTRLRYRATGSTLDTSGLMPFGQKCRANHRDCYSVAFLTIWIFPLTATWLAAKSPVGDGFSRLYVGVCSCV